MFEIRRSLANSELQEMYIAFLNELKLESVRTLSEDSKSEEIWVATDEHGEILGFASYYVPEHYLHLFYVRPDWRHRKVGTQLLQYLQREYGTTIKLKCLASNQGALTFYGRIGFETCETGQSSDGDYLLLNTNSPISC